MTLLLLLRPSHEDTAAPGVTPSSGGGGNWISFRDPFDDPFDARLFTGFKVKTPKGVK